MWSSPTWLWVSIFVDFAAVLPLVKGNNPFPLTHWLSWTLHLPASIERVKSRPLSFQVLSGKKKKKNADQEPACKRIAKLFLHAAVLVSVFLVENISSSNLGMSVKETLSSGYGHMIKEAMLHVYTWSIKWVWRRPCSWKPTKETSCMLKERHLITQETALTHSRVLWDSSELYSSHVVALLLFKKQDRWICLGFMCPWPICDLM